jgi:very-short-patch-repair endonuclease
VVLVEEQMFEEEATPGPSKGGGRSNLERPSPLGRSGGAPYFETKPGYMTANPESYVFLKERSAELKRKPTLAENELWEYLKNKKTGHKIRRQHIVDEFIPDFVCLIKKTIIEIDGKIHLKRKSYDEFRTQRLQVLGYSVVRFTNEEVIADTELVASKIKDYLDARPDIKNSQIEIE